MSLYKYDRGVPIKQKGAEKEEKQPPVEQGKEKEKEKEKDAEKRKIEVGPFPPKDAEYVCGYFLFRFCSPFSYTCVFLPPSLAN